MGDPRKLRPKAETPRKVWDAERIRTEHALRREYGLKNTRELWAMLEELKRMRRTSRRLLSLGEAGREQGAKVVAKLQRLGIAKGDIRLEDVLGLSVRDFLERRLQTLVLKKGLARTTAQARQIITHGFIAVGARRITIPSYMVTAGEEPTVTYYKAIDISPPEEPAAGAKGARNARAAYAKEAAAAPDSATAGAERPKENAAGASVPGAAPAPAA